LISGALLIPLSLIKDVAHLEKFTTTGIILATITIFTVITYSARVMLGYEDRAIATDIK